MPRVPLAYRCMEKHTQCSRVTSTSNWKYIVYYKVSDSLRVKDGEEGNTVAGQESRDGGADLDCKGD